MNIGQTFHKFYQKPLELRQQLVADHCGLNEEERAVLARCGSLDFSMADRMVENTVTTYPLPMGLAMNFVIDGVPRLIPMVTEEASTVAAASNAAKLSAGFRTSVDKPTMIGQIQIVKIDQPEVALKAVLDRKEELLAKLSMADLPLKRFGGGPRDLTGEILHTHRGAMLVFHLLIDVQDAMGANAVNTIVETFAPMVQNISGGTVRLRILSNLSTYRMARARTIWKRSVIGEEAIEGVLDAYAFAESSPYRAVTHNKGVMNGIDAVALATGNDFRALEACAHAWASIAHNGAYRSLTKYRETTDGDLEGYICIPLAVGLVGGVTKTHPAARLALKMLGVNTAQELAGIMAAVGLAQNFAALRALGTEGIQKGHMRMHSKNIAMMAGAHGDEVEALAQAMVRDNQINVRVAEHLLSQLRSDQGA